MWDEMFEVKRVLYEYNPIKNSLKPYTLDVYIYKEGGEEFRRLESFETKGDFFRAMEEIGSIFNPIPEPEPEPVDGIELDY